MKVRCKRQQVVRMAKEDNPLRVYPFFYSFHEILYRIPVLVDDNLDKLE